MNFVENSDLFGCTIEYLDLKTIKKMTSIDGVIADNIEKNSKIITKKHLGKMWGNNIIELVYKKYGFKETVKRCSEMTNEAYELILDTSYEYILKNKKITTEIFSDIYDLHKTTKMTDMYKLHASLKYRNKNLLKYIKPTDFSMENNFFKSLIYLTEEMFYSMSIMLGRRRNTKEQIKENIKYLLENKEEIPFRMENEEEFIMNQGAFLYL